MIQKHLTASVLAQLALALAQPAAHAAPAEFRFREEFLARLVEATPSLLEGQDPHTGRWGTGIWIVTDQHPIYPLAAVWAIRSENNPYYHDERVLKAVMDGGDALIDDADDAGEWIFRKKDGSTWGKIYMPWTYSRWIRAFGLVREGMPPERRSRWEKALLRGYAGISRSALGKVHNIPTHHAMGLFHAGQLFNREEWRAQARAFMAQVVAAQDPAGFWSEHHGPVVAYNFVYSDALGTYYAMSRDESVLPALARAARFHALMTYPDGSPVETVDERNPYHPRIAAGNVGFSLTPEGRGYLARQLALVAAKRRTAFTADDLASFVLYGEEGPSVATAAEERDRSFLLEGGQALIRRKAPWYVCLSAYHCPVPENRWIQDRQNLVSVFHDRVGLILGGGNTKLQPLWSTFTVGDPALLRHRPGDANPRFTPPPGIVHVPSAATIRREDPVGLRLQYGPEQCEIDVEVVDSHRVRLHLRATARSAQPVAAHLTFLPRLGTALRTERGFERKLDAEAFALGTGEVGAWLEHAGWRAWLPAGAAVRWPVLPHNPYRKDGAATPDEGRLVVTLPFSAEKSEQQVEITVGAP
ncbi:MAG: hypothetical protein QHJ73_09970 [Armatimonadota bacterium]|nr:hypothetical protein [Armatimonadota bacterium]